MMKDVSITSQIFSLFIVATMLGSALFLHLQQNEDRKSVV